MLKQQLQIKLSQKLSPQQIKLMKLIQLSTLDLEQKIETEMGENPALESGFEPTRSENNDTEFGISILGKYIRPNSLLSYSISRRKFTF